MPHFLRELCWCVGPVLAIIGIVTLLVACSPSTETVVKGDRSITQVTAGKLLGGDGDYRYFYVLRDPDTGVDYLAVIDAGIVRLDPVPAGKVEKP